VFHHSNPLIIGFSPDLPKPDSPNLEKVQSGRHPQCVEKLTDISRISVVVHVSDNLYDGKLQLTERQFPAYSVLKPIRIGVAAAL